MRMLTFALLLASATSYPALAQHQGHERRDGGQEDGARAANNEARQERMVERSRQRAQAVPGAARADGWNRGDRQARNESRPAPVVQAQPQGNNSDRGGNRTWQRRSDAMVVGTAQAPDQPRNDRWRGRDNDGNRDARRNDHDRNDGRDRDGRRWDGNRDGNRSGNSGTWHRNDNGRWEHRNDGDRNWSNHRGNHDWNRTWRNDRRYDWQRYRNQYRNHYRAPRYYNPYGYSYGYRRFGIGIYLDSLFFGSRYWLSDPWEYRLPPAPYGCRWVRYYDDVLLVDIRSGYVLDVIHDFFW